MEGRLPLEGVRILDFTWIGAGPLCTKLLAQYGAEVIKIESATHLDHIRMAQPIPPGKTGVNASGEWSHFNADKYGITLNMRNPRGRDLVYELVAVSDIIANNFGAGVMERWGLGYEEVRKVRPDIISLGMPVMGSEGPKKHYIGFGNGITALGGITLLMGEEAEEPVGFCLAYTDFTCNPYHAATAVMAALLHRELTGQGQSIELTQYQSAINFIGPAVMDYLANGRVPLRTGNRHPYAAPHGAYPCRGEDRWIAIAVFTDAQWEALCRILGAPALARDERFATLLARLGRQEALNLQLAALTRERDPFELMDALAQEGVPAGVVQSTVDIFERDPQLKARSFYTFLEHPELGRIAYPAAAFQLSHTQGWPRRPSPLLGQHNEWVFKEVLGFSEQRFADALVGGAIE